MSRFYKTTEIPVLLIATAVNCICFTFAHVQDEDFGLQPQFLLPKCMNVTIAREHYNSETNTLDNSIGGFHPWTTSSVRYGPGNETISLCFPLSPQLHICKKRKFGPKYYKMEHHVLTLYHSRFSAKLGDYFIDQESNAHVCTEAIQADKSFPRCNFITIETDMYAELGNGSLYINSTKSVLARATYTIDSEGKANVCYPLSIQTLNCKNRLFAFNSKNYHRVPNMNIAYKTHNGETYGPGEYYSLSPHGDIKVCVKLMPFIEYLFFKVYHVLSQLSLICLCLTLIYQLKIGQSKLHDKCLACYNITMIAHYVRYNYRISVNSCHAYFLGYFVLNMSTHTWLTLTTFDIWRSFSSMPTIPSRRTFRKNKTFAYYSILGWGSPFLCYILVLITNHYYDIFAYEYTVDTPTCWFKTLWPFFTFYFGPVLLLNGINIIFFIFTIRAIHREAKMAQAARNKGKMQVVIVCIKLFFIMGVSLIADGIMLSIQYYINFHYYYVSYAFTSTQGIAIFVVVICRRQAMQTIRKHFAKHKLQWNALTIICNICNRRKQAIYLVEENHLNTRSKQIACQARTYILHDDTEGDTFPRNNEFMMKML